MSIKIIINILWDHLSDQEHPLRTRLKSIIMPYFLHKWGIYPMSHRLKRGVRSRLMFYISPTDKISSTLKIINRNQNIRPLKRILKWNLAKKEIKICKRKIDCLEKLLISLTLRRKMDWNPMTTHKKHHSLHKIQTGNPPKWINYRSGPKPTTKTYWITTLITKPLSPNTQQTRNNKDPQRKEIMNTVNTNKI